MDNLFHHRVSTEVRPGYYRTDIPFLPAPKGAVKVAVFKGYAHKYMPKKTRDSIADLREYFRETFTLPPFEGPVAIRVTYYRRRPVSVKKWLSGGVAYDPKRPDMDNRTKTLHDAGTGILWLDDSQIVWEYKRKVFDIGDHTEIEVEELKEDGRKQDESCA